jgi:hypothetical protein
VASVVTGGRVVGQGEEQCAVRLDRLDDLLEKDACVGVAKLDVEGHESAVLRGAEGLLRRRAIRDIIFEDFGCYPTEAMLLLERFGYKLFSLAKGLFGPRLCAADRTGARPWDEPNYLATLDPRRAIDRMLKRGWAVLGRAGS